MAIYSRMNVPDRCQDWIKCLRQGEEQAIKHFFEKYHRRIFHFSLTIVKNEDDAADVVQETFIKLLSTRANINDERHLRNSLYQFAEQLSIICLRLRKSGSRLEEEWLHLSPAPNDPGAEESSREAERIESNTIGSLYQYIEELPAGCKEIFKLYYFENRSTKEIAERLQLSTQTVLNQKTRARNRLKELFRKHQTYFLVFFCLAALYF